MTQREALVTLIEFVRERAPENTRVLRAAKVAEKRAELLRARYEKRTANVPEDLFEEPLTLQAQELIDDLRGVKCRLCGEAKPERWAFCRECWSYIDGPMRKALRLPFRSGFEHAFCRVMRLYKTKEAAA